MTIIILDKLTNKFYNGYYSNNKYNHTCFILVLCYLTWRNLLIVTFLLDLDFLKYYSHSCRHIKDLENVV